MKFKVGERVHVYCGNETFKGEISGVSPPAFNSYFVIEDGFNSPHSSSPFHEKQLVRLKPKRKAREFWIPEIFDYAQIQNITEDGLKYLQEKPDLGAIPNYIHCREVIDKGDGK